MNRLTKQISLVLISSSLVLHGCYSDPVEEEKKKEEEKFASTPGSPGTPNSTSGGHYHHWGPHFFYGGSGISSRVGSSTGFRSSAGSSVRGGFGGSAHGVSS